MTAEAIVAELLTDSSITDLVSTRIALAQFPQRTQPPCLLYQVISDVPEPSLDYTASPIARARVQINPFANTIGSLKDIHAAVRAVMDFLHATTVAGQYVISSRLEFSGRIEKDNEAGVWTQPSDYIIQYYES